MKIDNTEQLAILNKGKSLIWNISYKLYMHHYFFLQLKILAF